MPKTIMKERLKNQGTPLEDTERRESEGNSGILVRGQRMSGPLRNYPSDTPPQQPTPVEPAYDPLKDELRMIDEEKEYQLRKARKDRLKDRMIKGFEILLIVMCVYLVFLIYGALNTNYTYNRTGDVVPVVVPVEEIKEQNDYFTISTQYLQARTLYEEALKLDYRIGASQSTGEDTVLIASEYEGILEKITKLYVQMSAITVPAKYTQPYNMLISWVHDDLALYCQYISRAITQNNAADMNQALLYRDSVYNKFGQITQVLVTHGTAIESSEVINIRSWSPEKFIEQITGGV